MMDNPQKHRSNLALHLMFDLSSIIDNSLGAEVLISPGLVSKSIFVIALYFLAPVTIQLPDTKSAKHCQQTFRVLVGFLGLVSLEELAHIHISVIHIIGNSPHWDFGAQILHPISQVE